MRLSIRRATEEDAEAILDVLNPIIQAGTCTVMAQAISLEEEVDFIRSFPDRGVLHVALCEGSGALLGLQDVVPISTEPAFAHVGAISTFVSIGAQGKGIARSLSEATFQAAREQGFTKLSATIRADNARAVAFYLRQGFTIIGTAQRHALTRGRYVDVILAERLLA